LIFLGRATRNRFLLPGNPHWRGLQKSRFARVAVLRYLPAIRPEGPVLMISGYSEQNILKPAESAPVRCDGFPRKPFPPGRLQQMIETVLAARASG